MKFTFKAKDANFNVSMRLDEISLPAVLDAVERFLKACGFQWDGTLDFVGPPVPEKTDAASEVAGCQSDSFFIHNWPEDAEKRLPPESYASLQEADDDPMICS